MPRPPGELLLESSVVERLLAMPAARQLPCLSSPAKLSSSGAGRRCGGCVPSLDFSEIKRCLLAAGSQTHQTLLALLEADAIKIPLYNSTTRVASFYTIRRQSG